MANAALVRPSFYSVLTLVVGPPQPLLDCWLAISRPTLGGGKLRVTCEAILFSLALHPLPACWLAGWLGAGSEANINHCLPRLQRIRLEHLLEFFRSSSKGPVHHGLLVAVTALRAFDACRWSCLSCLSSALLDALKAYGESDSFAREIEMFMGTKYKVRVGTLDHHRTTNLARRACTHSALPYSLK
jgi:hypothetical protein